MQKSTFFDSIFSKPADQYDGSRVY